MADLAGIKAKFQTIEIVQSLTGPAKGPDGQGRWMALCPLHDDDTASFRVFSDGGWQCFGCGARGGDVIDFVAAHRQIPVKDAIAALAAEGGLTETSAPTTRQVQQRAPASAPAFQPHPISAGLEHRVREAGKLALNYPDRDRPEIVSPAAIYAYRREAGGPASHLVLRIETGGRKVFRPAAWDGSQWWGVALPAPRPLYGLDQLGLGYQVLVVEGEKAADAARARLPKEIAVVTWQGGANSDGTADWEPLAGRSVVVWPDADVPGRRAAERILERLQKLGCRVKTVDTADLPDGWDAADLDPKLDMLAWLKDRANAKPAPAAPLDEPAAPEPAAPEPVEVDPGELAQQVREADWPFVILGQHGSDCWFLKRTDGRIVHYPLTSLTRREVLGTLAAPTVWQRAFGGVDTDGRPVGWPTIGMAAQAHIVASCERKPSFDPDRVRGRGCWPHRGGVAFSRGDWVEVNGIRQDGNLVDGVIYESLAPLGVEIEKQITDEEGKRLHELINACSWDAKASGAALAGWIALAPICGALAWRPHVWITGPSGSGKSTIMDEIVLPSVGRGYAIRVDGNTSEAGLRQAMGHDALPVLLDEAEPDAKSMRGILDLARSASMGDTIVRGTAGGGAQYFHARSAFCFSAINPAIAKRADESRISRLELRPRNDPQADAHFKRLRDEIANLITGDFGSRLAARSIALAPTTLRNISIMEDAIAAMYGSRRLAQQWGALLSGAWSLRSRTLIPDETAKKLAAMVPTESAQAQVEDTDARAMLMQIGSFQIEAPVKGGRQRYTIAELIDRASRVLASHESPEVTRSDAIDVLGRWGIRCDTKWVYVASNYATLRNVVFRDTNWQHSYTARLRELPGAKAGGQYRFAGTRCSSTSVPIEHFTGGKEFDGWKSDREREGGDRSDSDEAAEGAE